MIEKNKISESKEITSSPRSGVDTFSRYRFVSELEVNYRDFLDLPYYPDARGDPG